MNWVIAVALLQSATLLWAANFKPSSGVSAHSGSKPTRGKRAGTGSVRHSGRSASRGPASRTSTSSRSASSRSATSQSISSQSTSRSRRAGGNRRQAKVVVAPSYQLHPDPERYQEIQKALAEKGFFKGEANGQWGDDSVDALKRFQAESKLTDDGKLSSLTLIGLGLGPRPGGSSAASSAPFGGTPAAPVDTSQVPVVTQAPEPR